MTKSEDEKTEKMIQKEKKRVEKENKKEEKRKKKEEKYSLRTPEQNMRRKFILESIITILVIVVIISAYVSINIVIRTLEISDIDLTKEKFYSLSYETKEQLKNISKEIIIYVFGYNEDSSMTDLVKQYSKYKDNIKVEVVTVETRPDIAQEYNISLDDQNSGLILITSEGRNIKAFSNDFYTMNYETNEYVDLSEQKLTNSILAVTLETSPKIYFLTGHGEYTLNTYLTYLSSNLKSEINEVETLDLLVKNEIPDDCETLIIYNPSTDFTDFETELITKYINNGGNILWLSDYKINEELTNTKKILDLYGVSVNNKGIIIEQEKSKMLMQTPDLILPTISTSTEITKGISNGGKVVLLDSGKIDVKSDEELESLGVTINILLKTSDKAFFRTDLSKRETKAMEGEEVGSFTTGLIADKIISGEGETKTSKLVLYSNAIFGTDQPIAISNQSIPIIYIYNNLDLVMNSISYLTEKTETITIRKTVTSVPYSATEQQDAIVRIVIFTFPIVIIAIGVVVWIVRRRKK